MVGESQTGTRIQDERTHLAGIAQQRNLIALYGNAALASLHLLHSQQPSRECTGSRAYFQPRAAQFLQ
jgi:hypothetical protein